MKILIDTDVLLDVALRRPGFFENSAAVFLWAESNPGRAGVAWHSLSNIAYLLRPDACGFIRDLLEFVEVPTTGTGDMKLALASPMTDLEDAMQVAAAIAFGADRIVTRNRSDYRRSTVRVVSPSEFVEMSK